MSTEALEILMLAAETPCGLVVRTNDFGLARQRLYASMRASAPTFNDLQLSTPPNGASDELWIIKKSALPPKAAPPPEEGLASLPHPSDLKL